MTVLYDDGRRGGGGTEGVVIRTQRTPPGLSPSPIKVLGFVPSLVPSQLGEFAIFICISMQCTSVRMDPQCRCIIVRRDVRYFVVCSCQIIFGSDKVNKSDLAVVSNTVSGQSKGVRGGTAFPHLLFSVCIAPT